MHQLVGWVKRSAPIKPIFVLGPLRLTQPTLKFEDEKVKLLNPENKGISDAP